MNAKIILTFFVILFSSGLVFAQNTGKYNETQNIRSTDVQIKNTNTTTSDNKVYEVVEQRAEFPGGESELMKWLSSNIIYPEDALNNNIQGKVIVSFVIEKDGSISDVKVVKGADIFMDKAAVMAIKKMPKWEPGKNNGVAVRTSYTLPIIFRLTDS